MRFSDSIILLLSLSSPALGASAPFETGAGHDALKPLSHTAYHRVEQMCATDVERLCKEEEEERELTTFSSPMASSPTSKDSASVPTPTSSSSSDPFLDIVFSSSPLSEELSDFSRFMDQLFESVIATSYSSISSGDSSNSDERGLTTNGDGASSASSSSTSTFFYSSPSSSFVIYEETPTIFIDYGVARLAAEKEPDEIPLLASQLQSYGSSILLSSMGGVYTTDCPYRNQMARRLTEMDAKTIQYHVRLPFGTTNNVCLKRALGMNKVSSECVDSINRLEKTFVIEEMGYESVERMSLIHCVTVVFLGILLLALCVKRQDEDDDYDYYDYESDDDDDDDELDEDGKVRYALLEDDKKEGDKEVLIVHISTPCNGLSSKRVSYEAVPLQIV